MYNVFYFILLVCGSVRLEELECPAQVEDLTVSRVSSNTLTATWAKFRVSDCGPFFIYLTKGNLSHAAEMRFIRSVYTVTFIDLDPCSDYFLHVSPLAQNALHFIQNTVVIQSVYNFSQLIILRVEKQGTFVYKSNGAIIAEDFSDNSNCYPATENRNDAETEIIEQTGITLTTPFVQTTANNLSTISARTTEITTITAVTTLEDSNRPTTDGSHSCALGDIPTEVDSLKVTLTSEKSLNVSWSEPPCVKSLFLINLSHENRFDVRELRLLQENSAQFLDLEECQTYTVSVTPISETLVWQFTDFTFYLGTRVSWVTSEKITTAEISNVTVSNLMVSETTRSSIAVSWTAPPHRVCYDKYNRFYVEIEPYGSDSADVNKRKGRSTNWNELELADLEPCAAYRVSVTVGFVGGFKSADKSSIVAITLPGKISNLTAVNVTSTSLAVSWKSPSFWDCVVGKDKYIVTLESSSAPKLWHVDTNSILLSDLEPCTSHEISVGLVVVGEVDPSLKAFITVYTLSDSLTDCISANKATVVLALPVCIVLVAAVAFVVLLRYRGLTIGRTQWKVTDHWRVVRETIRNKDNHSVTTTSESSIVA